jgi:uridine kinase
VGEVGHRPVVVGIDGPGGSGKSTFARELAAVISGTTWIVQGDDFYSDLPTSERVSLGAEEGCERYFDWYRLKSDVLSTVRLGASELRYRQYDWDAETLGDWLELSMPEVLIVEGVYTLRKELRDAFDVTVLLQARRDTRDERQTLRNENSAFWISHWMAAEDFYFVERGPWEWVDFMVETD